MVVVTCELVATVRVANTLGEGVLWNRHTDSAWWTDIQESRIYEYDPESRKLRSRDTPYRVACFGFVEGSSDLVVAFDSGIARFAPDSGAVDWLVAPGCLADGLRFNDGRIDPRGRFWVGAMVEDRSIPEGSAALYCYEPGAGLAERITGVTIANGLCWSPDAAVMYFADSPRSTIRAYGFDLASGLPSAPRLFARTDPGVHPDGSTVDADGGVWNAQWGGGQVLRYAPDGHIDQVLRLPVSQPTCVAFGGPDLDLLFVTTARAGLSAEQLETQPSAGDLFVYRTGYRGLPAPEFH